MSGAASVRMVTESMAHHEVPEHRHRVGGLWHVWTVGLQPTPSDGVRLLGVGVEIPSAIVHTRSCY